MIVDGGTRRAGVDFPIAWVAVAMPPRPFDRPGGVSLGQMTLGSFALEGSDHSVT